MHCINQQLDVKVRPSHPWSCTTFPTHYEESIGVVNNLKLHFKR